MTFYDSGIMAVVWSSSSFISPLAAGIVVCPNRITHGLCFSSICDGIMMSLSQFDAISEMQCFGAPSKSLIVLAQEEEKITFLSIQWS